jgi:outer membrane protein TolC
MKTNNSNQRVMSIFSNSNDFTLPNRTPEGFHICSHGIYPMVQMTEQKPLAHNVKQLLKSIFQRNTQIIRIIALLLLVFVSVTTIAQPQLENKSSSSRLAKTDKAQFATANEHLAVERNEEIDDLGQALNGYLKQAAENNPGLKYQFNNYMAALQRVDQIASLPDPQIAFGYFILPVETRNGPQTFKLSYSQMFPWFGTLNNQESMTTHRAKSNYEVFEEAKSQLFLDVKSAYYQLYFIEKSQRIIKENIQILETFKSLALIKIEAGKASAVDELRVEMQLADLENKQLYLRDQWLVNTVKFNRLLNVKNNAVIKLPDSLWADDFSLEFQAAMDSLKANNHQLRNFDHKMESYQNQETVAKKKGTPNILLGADYIGIGDNGLNANSGKDALFVKVGITIPMYRKKYNGAIQEAALMQQVTEDQKADKTNALETLFEKTWSDYLDAKRRVDLFAKQSSLAQKAIRILQSEYQSNGSNFEEVLRMEKDLLKYELETQKALADKQAAIAFLEYLIGR